MSKAATRMVGLILMLVSIFPLYTGMIVGQSPGMPGYYKPLLMGLGLGCLVLGVVFYKILKTDV